MEWTALEEHYCAATRQTPSPVEGAIEWDYSRYARALGLTGMPGLHDLPHTGYAVLAAPPAAWDEAADRYGEWAAREGWRHVRLSARATVAVPDPVAYGLGVAVAGRDGLIFARSGRGGPPALGKRPRAPGCSLPLAPGERWLIATDRVRRRVRSEIATRGLVIQVDEAHRLAASAMTLLAHLIHAHCAWRDRMLSRDARVYVVFATPPAHERAVTDMLARFGMNGAPHVARRPHAEDAVADGVAAIAPIRTPGCRSWPHLTAEQEHLWEALHAAPLALTEDDVATVFGTSATGTARALIEGGYIESRDEDGQRCYVPNPSAPAPPNAPEQRVVKAIRDHYRTRQRMGGHQHLTYAVAELELRLGRTTHAAAQMSRAGLGTTATVPLPTATTLLDAWESAESPSAVALGIAAQLRLPTQTESIVRTMTTSGWRSPRFFLRDVLHLLALGRTLLDRVIPLDFWASVTVRGLEPALLDAVAIGADLFARMRLMTASSVIDRFAVATQCISSSREVQGASRRLRQVTEFLLFRTAVSLRGRMSPGSECTLPEVDVHALVRLGAIPAYAIGTLVYAEACGRTHSGSPNFDERDRSMALTLIEATGNPADLRVQLTGLCIKFVSDGLRLLGRELADESTLVLDPESPKILRHRLASNLHCLAGIRARELSAATLLLRHRERAGGNNAVERVIAGRGLLLSGEYAAAHDNFAAASVGPFSDGAQAALLVASEILLDRKTLSWDEAERARVALKRHENLLPRLYLEYASYMIQASESLCKGEIACAERSFQAARRSLGANAIGLVEVLRKDALEGELAAKALSSVQGDPLLAAWHAIAEAIKRITRRISAGYSPNHILRSLDYLLVAVERSDIEAAAPDDVLSVALAINENAGPSLRAYGKDVGESLAAAAPRFFKRLQDTLRGEVGSAVSSVPATRAVATDLTLLKSLGATVTPELRGEPPACEFLVRRCRVSRAIARRLSTTWVDDASTLARVCADSQVRAEGRRRARINAVAFSGERATQPHLFQVEYEYVHRASGVVVKARSSTAPPHERMHRTDGRGSSEAKRTNRLSIHGSSSAANGLRLQISTAAACEYPVLIVGETGAGKERVARSIHEGSSRHALPLVVVDCGAIADALLEAELFGHERGAFTGAMSARRGLFADADGASLLLDEFDSVSPRMQAMLLRVIETGEFRPVGSEHYRHSDFRLLVAARPTVHEHVRHGTIRQDLYFRISALEIAVPPLRERGNDIAALAIRFAEALGRSLTCEALDELVSYRWPGNVRQLRSCVEFSSVLESSDRIGRPAVMKALQAYDAQLSPRQLDLPAPVSWQRVLSRLEQRDQFAATEFARVASVSRRSAQRHLTRLVKQGLILRVGAGRSTRYRVVREET